MPDYAKLRHRILTVICSIVTGWAVLFPVTYLLERPLITWAARLVGAYWLATAKVSLDCMALAATGWMIGRLNRSGPVLGALAFAAALGFFNLDPMLDISLRWLIRLGADAFRDSAYLEPFATTAVQHFLLFVSLMGGALLSRPAAAPLSVFGEQRVSSNPR